MSKSEISILSFAGIVALVGTIVSMVSPDFFVETYVPEDGFVEWMTVVALLFSAGLMIRRAWRLKGKRSAFFLFVTCFAALIFIFGAGEEISWGQRIFGIETPEWLEENNKQQETNFHNLVIGDVSMNKLIFSKILGVCLLFYLLIIPITYRFKPKFARWIDSMGVPLPSGIYVTIWILTILWTEFVVGTGKRGELREFCLTFILAAQLLAPLNPWIYKGKTATELARPVNWW
ncbi:MAG: hypothetical protein P1U86_16775 [Verrucomicrobiales bacterium]|nr:hypothetical protein [Verrucomicrobiales bacterium]